MQGAQLKGRMTGTGRESAAKLSLRIRIGGQVIVTLCGIGLLCSPRISQSAALTTTAVQAAGSDWNAAIWKTNGTGTAVSPVAGNFYQCVSNGTVFGYNTSNTRIRNPTVGNLVTFPGDSLTLFTNTEIRIKAGSSGPLLNFPGIGSAPGLILSGGILNVGDDAVFTISGRIQVSSCGYICPGDGGGGPVKPLRGVNLSGQLSGIGTMIIFQGGTTVAQRISGDANTFSGPWIIKAAWLLASGLNSLGTNGVTVDPNYVLPLTGPIQDVAGPAWFEPGYDLNSAGRLVLTNGGVMVLHQNCVFSSVVIQGATLSSGTHSYAELAANFPGNFAVGGSGSITIQPYGPPPAFPPSITQQPLSMMINAGAWTQLVASASGGNLSYQWQKGTNTTFINVADAGDVTGSKTGILTFSAIVPEDAADYRLMASNPAGSATSQVASVTVVVPDDSRPIVALLNPIAGSTMTTLTQIQVTFNEPVLDVQAGDLLVNGIPATTVSGTGSTYAFGFSQPPPGTISVYWDIDNGIKDAAGNPLNTSPSWSYKLIDNIPPALASTVPAQGATVGLLSQGQVMFTEPVTGVSAADLLLNGFPALDVSGAGFGPYVFHFSAPQPGPLQFSWAAGQQIQDLQSNRFAGAGWTANLDPTVAAAALTNLVINEILTANVNTNGLRDEDFELNDWIELYNRGALPINLSGWSLTDDPEQPGKWTFPLTNIGPGQYLVVFASGKDRRAPGAELHTNFKLNSIGNYLGLFSSDSPPQVAYQYTPAYPAQRNDVSYGLDAANALRYFNVQTPGGPNSISTITGLVDQVQFSIKHGYFNQPFNLVLTTRTPGASIIYTTDGSQPANGNGSLYGGPIHISNTTVVRAVAFAPALLPSQVESRSYLFLENIVRQPNDPAGYPTGYVWTPVPGTVQNGSRAYYQMDPAIVNDPQYSNTVRSGLLSIPTMSLVLPIPDLFDPNTGIYTHPESRGPAWEKACSMELIFPDGSDGLQMDCGLQIQGGTQRDPNKNAKHSFRVSFKGDYGAGRLKFPLFPDSPVETFNTLVLDGGINMWWHYVGANSAADQRFRAQCVRDQFASDLMGALGQPTCHGRFYHVYLNGLYWGLHYIHERPDDAFAADYLGGNSTDYDVLRNTSVGLEILAGDDQAWNAALALSTAGLSDNLQFLQLQQYVDVDNLIDYMVVNHWLDNEDWPQHNWYVIRRRAPGAGFQFIEWDAEHVLKTPKADRTTANTAGSPAQIYNALRNNAEFRLQYADHLQKHFFNGGLLYTDPNPTNALYDSAHPERNLPAAWYMRRIKEIDTAIVDESARWGGYLLTTNYTRNIHWLRELNNLLGYTNNPGNTYNFFPGRSTTVLNQYKALGLFPSVIAPALNQYGGNVPVGFSLSMSNANSGGTIYYTTNGADPRMYGSGAVSMEATPYSVPVVLRNSTVVKARVFVNGNWSPLIRADFGVALLGIPVRITEIMYRPIGGDAYEFIELQNIGSTPVDLSSFSFEGITYVFPDNSTLAAGAVIVLASSVNPAAFALRYPGVTVAGYYSGALNNQGERIALLDRNHATIASVTYGNAAGWPTAADGGGYSLEILDPNADPNDPANWRASTVPNGTPGLANASSLLPAVRLNELMADNAGAVTNGGTFPDWLELYNAGSNPVSLAGWSLSISGDPRKFVFPKGTSLAGGGYLVVWCDGQTNAPGLHTGFTLGRKGESLFLYDSLTNRVDSVGFGLQVPNYSLGRIGTEGSWQLTLPTPWSNNVPVALAAATNLVINEWLANSLPGAPDWLELFNRSATLPVSLSGLYFATSNSFFQLRSLSFLGPQSFAQLFADENPGPEHLDFKLSAAGDSITLYDPSGQRLDAVAFGVQAEGVSQGRLPDGFGWIVSFPGTASPGASNYVAVYSGPVLNEVMARNVSAVYDARGNNPDWIELYNPNSTPFSLAGMRLSADLKNPAQFVFPSAASIAALSYLRVWCDSSHPASTNNGPDLNTGFALNAQGDAIYLFNTNAQIVDSVAFGFQVADKSIGLSSGVWTLLNSPTPGAPNDVRAPLGSPVRLRLNEWMAYPVSGSDWFELYNSDPLPVSLGGLYLTDDPSITGITNSPIAPLSFIGGHSWARFNADADPGQGPNHTRFNLNKDGQTLRIYDAGLQLIDSVDFALQSSGVSQGRLPDSADQFVSFPITPTPDASNYLPLDNAVINEVLTHSDPPLEDAIELYNPAATDLTLGGWFISNSDSDFKKYRIPDGVVLPAHGYRVFYEFQFNSTNAVPFTLNSAHGDWVYLSQADGAGNLTGYRAQVSFGGAGNGVSLGRFMTSVGVDFVPLAGRTFGDDNPTTVDQFRTGTGLTNAPAKVGPVVINEIMFHPVTWSGTNTSENPDEEYLELLNTSSDSVPLYDPASPTNCWKLTGGIDFVFPPATVLSPGGFALVVGFDPVVHLAALTNFKAKYNLATNVLISGPYRGRLDNAGEAVGLYRPDTPQSAPHPDAGFVPYLLVEQISYSSTLPWPEGANGTGMSLQRRFAASYGNEPLNWLACAPTPAAVNCGLDSDNDGLPDDWEIAHHLDPYSSQGINGAEGDPDGDGFTNLQEYLAGTDPQDTQSYLKIDSITLTSTGVMLRFLAVGGHSYTLQFSDGSIGPWQKLADVEVPVVTGPVEVPDLGGAVRSRFYRLATPRLP